MSRKGENIRKRKDGRWEGRIKATVSNGKTKYKSFYGKTYREVMITESAAVKALTVIIPKLGIQSSRM